MLKDEKATIGDVYPTLKAEYVSKQEALQHGINAIKRRRWTQHEFDVLAYGVRNGLTSEEIAKMINRTAKAVDVRIHNSGIRRELSGKPKRQMKRYKRRITYGVMKKRILEFVGQHQPVTITELINGATGRSERIREVADRMIDKGDLKTVYAKRAGHLHAQRYLALPSFVEGEAYRAVKGTIPTKTAKPVEVTPLEIDDAPVPAGGLLSDRNLGHLILFAGIGAAGVWLVMILLAISLIENMGG